MALAGSTGEACRPLQERILAASAELADQEYRTDFEAFAEEP